MSFQLTILGTGSATPVLNRHPTSHHLVIDQEGYLIDCGEGTQLQLLAYKLRPSRIKYIFITHLHGDHYFGLIGLLSTFNLHRRMEDLWIFGPKGLAEIITIQLKYSDSRLMFKIHFVETETEKSYQLFENEHVTVHTIPLIHRVPCCGFLIREKERKRKLIKEIIPSGISYEDLRKLKDGFDILDENGQVLYKNADYTTEASNKPRSYAFCSDTLYHKPIIEQVRGVDLLYYEATFLDELSQRAFDTNHSTALQAGMVARDAEVGKLIIGHFSSRYKVLDDHLIEARSVFPNTDLAVEGDSILIGNASVNHV